MTTERSTWNAGTWITSFGNLVLGIVAASATLLFAGSLAAHSWEGAAGGGAVSVGTCLLALAVTFSTSGHTFRVAVISFIVGASVAVAFWLYVLFLLATGEMAVVPDDLLGEPGSCFAGC